MKGFIEVTHPDGSKRAVNVSIIESFISEAVVIESGHYSVKETYAELKALIEEATRPTECNECPYSYEKTIEDAMSVLGFEESMKVLNGLGIRKEK